MEPDSRLDERSRRWRLVPPAITPLTVSDLGAGVVGQLRGTGRDAFRREVEAYLDAEGSATYTSFRRTLGACLRELERQNDDGRNRILVPSFCSSDFADAIEGVGLVVERYDVDPETLAFDPTSVDAGLREEPLAVVAVNVLGYSSPMDELARRCSETDAYLVEALGYALGTEYEGDRLGTFGDCAVLNFQQGKPIPIGGGMVVTQNPTLEFGDEDRPAVAPNAGVLAGYAAFSRPRPYYLYTRLSDILDEVGRDGRVSTHPESKLDVWYSRPFATISDFQGAVGRRVLRRLDDNRRDRHRTAQFYADALSDCPGVDQLTPVAGLSKVQYVRYPILVETETLRDAVREALRASGIQATTLYDYPPIDASQFPGAADLQRRIVTLPTHPYVDDRDRHTVVETIRDVVESYGSDQRPAAPSRDAR